MRAAARSRCGGASAATTFSLFLPITCPAAHHPCHDPPSARLRMPVPLRARFAAGPPGGTTRLAYASADDPRVQARRAEQQRADAARADLSEATRKLRRLEARSPPISPHLLCISPHLPVGRRTSADPPLSPLISRRQVGSLSAASLNEVPSAPARCFAPLLSFPPARLGSCRANYVLSAYRPCSHARSVLSSAFDPFRCSASTRPSWPP